jgi:hypothetical protein
VSSKGSSGEGSSDIGFQHIALSMPGMPWSWKHGRGPERLLPRRAARSSTHTGLRAAGPSGPMREGHQSCV